MNCACMSVGKPGYGSVARSTGRNFALGGPHFHRRLAARGFDPGAPQRIKDRFEIPRTTAVNLHSVAHQSGGDDVRARLDPIGQNVVPRSSKPLDSVNLNRFRTRALNSGAHRGEHLGELLHLGLARAFSSTVGPWPARRHQHVLRAGDGLGVEAESGPLEAFGLGLDVALGEDHRRRAALSPLRC